MRGATHAVADHVAGSLGAARRGDAGEIRHRSAAHQQSRAVRRIAQHLLEPADAKQLHFGRGGPERQQVTLILNAAAIMLPIAATGRPGEET